MSDVNEESTIWRTKDLNTAAYVRSLRGGLDEKGERKRVEIIRTEQVRHGAPLYFVFSIPLSKEDVNKSIEDYFNHKALIDPLEFVQNQEVLKDLLHAKLGIQVKRSKKNE